MKFFFKLIFLIIILKPYSQIISEKWYIIHNDPRLKVELSFDFPSGPCYNSNPTLYKYRFNGYLSDYSSYVNWKVDYMDCNGDNYSYGNVNNSPSFFCLQKGGEPPSTKS